MGGRFPRRTWERVAGLTEDGQRVMILAESSRTFLDPETESRNAFRGEETQGRSKTLALLPWPMKFVPTSEETTGISARKE